MNLAATEQKDASERMFYPLMLNNDNLISDYYTSLEIILTFG